MKSLEYHGRLIFYPVDQVFSNHSIKRILLKRNFICMGALYTATPHKSVFTFWLKCSFKGQTGSSHSSGHIPQRLLIRLGVKCHLPSWFWVIWPCPAYLTPPWLTNEPQPSPCQGSYKGCPHLCSSIPLV